MADRELPPGWAIKRYTGEEGAIIKGPGVAQHIDGDRDDACTLFWSIYDAGRAEGRRELTTHIYTPPEPGKPCSVCGTRPTETTCTRKDCPDRANVSTQGHGSE